MTQNENTPPSRSNGHHSTLLRLPFHSPLCSSDICGSCSDLPSFCVFLILDSFRIPCIIILPASSSSLTDCQLASIVLTATTELHIFISSLHSTQTGSRALAIHGSKDWLSFSPQCTLHLLFWALLLLVLIDCVDSSLLSSFLLIFSSLRIGLIFTLDPLFTALCCSSVTSPLASITSIVEAYHCLIVISFIMEAYHCLNIISYISICTCAVRFVVAVNP